MNRIVLFLFVTLCSLGCECQVLYTPQDYSIYKNYISELKKNNQAPIADVLVETALFFKGNPYVASTLDSEPRERLVVNLREFDCTTFVESCIALSRNLKSKNTDFDHFVAEQQTIRYREGIIKDYSSRLHYMTDWVFDNSRKEIFSDISHFLGGIKQTKKINYMSTHSDAYKALSKDPDLHRKILNIEDTLNERGGYYYLKKDAINEAETNIKNGDIIIFATTIGGLDYSHIGIAYFVGKKLTFIHASTRSMKVVIEPLSLYDYCMRSSNCTGITVLRLNEIGYN